MPRVDARPVAPPPEPMDLCAFCGGAIDMKAEKNWRWTRQVVADGKDGQGRLKKRPGRHVHLVHVVCPLEDVLS